MGNQLLLAIRHIGRIDVFASRHDAALKVSSAIHLKAPLGLRGAEGKQIPSNIVIHDVTDVLGRNDDVHERYVTRAGAAAIRLGEILR